MKDLEKLDLAFFGAKAKAIAMCKEIVSNPEEVDGNKMLGLYAALTDYKVLYDEVAASMRGDHV